MVRLTLCGAAVAIMLSGAITPAAAQAKGLVRSGAPEQLQKRHAAALRRPEAERVARRECVRYRGWGTQFGDCLEKYRARYGIGRHT